MTSKIRSQFPDGAIVERCEWGNFKQALKTLCSIYGEVGKDFVVLA